MSHIATFGDGLSRQKSDIQMKTLDGGNVRSGTALDQVRSNTWISADIGAQQIGQESGGERREDPNSNGAGLAASEGPSIGSCALDSMPEARDTKIAGQRT